MNISLRRLASLAMFFAIVSTARGQEPPRMVAHFINVGQGACTLLEFPCGAVLIDTGAQDVEHVERLAGYLQVFFARRTDLNQTLNTMIITHPHIDHTRGIKAVTDVCRVRSFVDNGVIEGSGRQQVRWIRDNASELGVHIRDVADDEIEALPHRNGLSDEWIDGIQCPTCDPRIVILSGRHTTNPGWSDSAFKNWNNHSLVIRVDFGDASFLFTGDLETHAIHTLLDDYAGVNAIDVDVYHVGHHGSYNGTTREFVDAMSPEIAVLGVGRWEFGQGQIGGFTTFQFGHPRKVVIDLLSAAIPGNRSRPLTTVVFTGSRDPVSYTVRRRIYATGWDGDVKIHARLDGKFRVFTSSEAPDEIRRDLHTLARPGRVGMTEAESGPAFDSVAPEPTASLAINGGRTSQEACMAVRVCCVRKKGLSRLRKRCCCCW